MNSPKSARKVCRHCNLCVVTRPRGLCWKHFQDESIRNLYPSKEPNASAKEMPTCFACGVEAFRQSFLQAMGWEVVVRRTNGRKVTECYCPICIERGDGPPDWDEIDRKYHSRGIRWIEPKSQRVVTGIPSLPLPEHSTEHRPGTAEKISVMQERADGGYSVCHPKDAK